MGHDELPRTEYVEAPPTRFLQVVRRTAAVALRLWYDVRVHGSQHLPTTGPVILACNHIGLLDGPLLTAFAARPVHALVKREMFVGFTGQVLRAAGQISIERSSIDPFAIKQTLRVLRDGRVVAIYPEGTRGRGDVAHARLGAAYFAMVTGAVVIPVAQLGTRTFDSSVHAVAPRSSRVDLVFGPELRAAAPVVPWPRRRAEVSDVAEDLRIGLARHVHDSVLMTGQRLPGVPPDVEVDADGRRGPEVGPEAGEQAS